MDLEFCNLQSLLASLITLVRINDFCDGRTAVGGIALAERDTYTGDDEHETCGRPGGYFRAAIEETLTAQCLPSANALQLGVSHGLATWKPHLDRFLNKGLTSSDLPFAATTLQPCRTSKSTGTRNQVSAIGASITYIAPPSLHDIHSFTVNPPPTLKVYPRVPPHCQLCNIIRHTSNAPSNSNPGERDPQHSQDGEEHSFFLHAYSHIFQLAKVKRARENLVHHNVGSLRRSCHSMMTLMYPELLGPSQ